jgi:salicylate hydroxylase
MNQHVWVAGGGIGGLACALAMAREGVSLTVVEQAAAFGEVGAGLQLGPNAVRVLHEWGLGDALSACAAFPEALRVRDARTSHILGQMPLGSAMLARYGQRYATVHRADLHRLLLDAVQARPQVRLMLGTRLAHVAASAEAVRLTTEGGEVFTGDALIGCDGLWSRVRQALLGEEPARPTGHLAYRGMVPSRDMPIGLRGSAVTAWLGPRLHVVHYPVRGGDWFNVVAVVHGVLGQGHGTHAESWHHEAHLSDLKRALGPVSTSLREVVEAVPEWKLWALHDRPPVRGPHGHAQGRMALLGDAAHPMRPYLAQGAAMALEDAWTLGRLLPSTPRGEPVDWPPLLARYARTRWARNARVQARAQRNGTVFHARGLVKIGRNLGLALAGPRLMDSPWLYSGPPHPIP